MTARLRRLVLRRPALRRLGLGAVCAIVLLVLAAPAAGADPGGGCAIAPEPDRPGTGLVGLLDPTPAGTGAPGSVYAEVGYAGTTWRTFDVCARPDAAAAGADTWVGSQLFNVAKVLVAAADGLHHQLAAGGGLDGLDGALHRGVVAVYQNVFTTWVGPALLVLAVALLVLAARGDLAAQARRGLVALVALMLGSAAYLAPVSLLSASDSVLLDGIGQVQQGFLTQLGQGDAQSLPTTLTDQIVYRNWLRGEFGSDTAPQATALGRDLLRAQTFTRAEVSGGHDTPDDAARKKKDFLALTSRLGDRYAQFQGIAGSRVGAGGIALVQALALAAFPAAASLVTYVALVVLRLLVLLAPLLAVVVILRPQVLSEVFRLAAGVAVNALVAGTLAAVQAWLVVTMLGSGVDPVLALVVAGVVSVLFWTLVRPVRRLRTLGTMAVPVVRTLVGAPGPPAPPTLTRSVDADRAAPPVRRALPRMPVLPPPAAPRAGTAATALSRRSDDPSAARWGSDTAALVAALPAARADRRGRALLVAARRHVGRRDGDP